MATTNYSKLVDEFLNYLEIEKNRSLLTVRNYKFYLDRFQEWGRLSSVKQITSDRIRKYRLHLNRLEGRDNTLKKTTQNYHLIALRSFLKYIAKRDIKALAPDKIELAKAPGRQVEFLDGTDLERFLEAPLSLGKKEKPIIQLRDKAVLELLFSTGLRVSEAAGLRRDDVNLAKDEFSVRGKGDKIRVVFLSDAAKNWLAQYLQARHDMNPYLFVSHDKASAKRSSADTDKPMTTRSIQRLVEKYATVAGLRGHITPHTIRHSYATDLLQGGADIRSVQAMLGHSSITTTQIYTHVTNKQLADVHKNFHRKKK